MSILISPSDNRGWGAMRRRPRPSMRGVGVRRRPMTLRSLLGLGTRRTRRSTRRGRISGGATRTTTRIVAVRTTSGRRRRR
ncbi:protein VII [Southern Psittacara leucophthalmus aviadenovirus]|uniref:Protein VII n=1 Tax=Southern Psittacara leucophthalmus aviadenovirus TaxID=2604330 RepID=A0AAE6M6N4_9ADEN|nr:protein VII [Southern Psittacara leucophthalmus aviadenovirus]QEJ80772.1 protein VII [Southern Psittacara leucophthalmus aviadenovirus]